MMSFKRLKLLIYFLILLSVIASAWYVLNKDLLFHTDIARDFLVLEDMVKTQKPTLIGPRSGGISGVFHGPLWFYLNLPAFILGGGSPVIVAWFWVFLSIFSIGITYYVGRKLFDEKIALVASFLLSVLSISYTNSLFNPFGAVITFPVFFYLFLRYLKSTKVLYLISALFCLGLTIQFQIAFGVPILILSTIYLVPFFLKKKKFFHIFSYLILLIPLSTYILFELRHEFLQVKSVVSYITTKQKEEVNFLMIFLARIKGIFIDGLKIVPQNNWLSWPVMGLFGYLIYKLRLNKIKAREIYFLFFYFYIGYWVIALFYKGTVWSYYYWPFLPVTLLILASSFKLLNKKLFFMIITYIFLANFYYGVQAIKEAGGGWKFFYNMARDIYKDAGRGEFGYYVYTPDQFGYSEKYALSYVQKEFLETKSYPFKKKETLYLTIAPPPGDRLFLDGTWWKSHQVNIKRKPNNVFKYPNGFVVEKYSLSKEEIDTPSDPNLIQDLTFR